MAFWNCVIRPPRADYEMTQLGPPEFFLQGIRASRKDLVLKTPQGVIECSHFVPRRKAGEESQQRPVVVYLHGNSGSRVDSGSLLEPLMRRGMSLFTYDSIGCGLSGGSYVSLGWHESDVLASVMEHLRRQPFCGKVAVWGRSMGAATALMYLERDSTLAAVLLDSAFASLPQLIEELATQGDCDAMIPLRLPSFIFNPAMSFLRSRVQALADFDIEDVVPLIPAAKSSVPALFLHAQDDTFVMPSHAEALFKAYAGRKELRIIQGDHNTRRSAEDIEAGVDWLCHVLDGSSPLDEMQLFDAEMWQLESEALRDCVREISPKGSRMTNGRPIEYVGADATGVCPEAMRSRPAMLLRRGASSKGSDRQPPVDPVAGTSAAYGGA